ncbi:MAG TPA: hypothetical protein VFI23_17570 [Rhizomicrobium sp.]|nr:hypothetical protein [Rhizomicrobium sp.]
MKPIPVIGALLSTLFFCSGPALAQQGVSAAPPAAFAPVTGIPVPVLSASGRFSSLNPPNWRDCPYKEVSGRVVSTRLILVKEMDCGRPGHDNVLVNVRLRNPADAAQMVAGRPVVVAAKFQSAEEDRDPRFFAEFLIADQAELVGGDRSAPPVQAFTSYMMCQPPELDALATRLGRELCVQNTLVADLAQTGPALEAAARAPARVSPEDPVTGDPNAISCRLDPKRSDTHLPATACARGSYWAWYRTKWDDPLSPTPAPP